MRPSAPQLILKATTTRSTRRRRAHASGQRVDRRDGRAELVEAAGQVMLSAKPHRPHAIHRRPRRATTLHMLYIMHIYPCLVALVTGSLLLTVIIVHAQWSSNFAIVGNCFQCNLTSTTRPPKRVESFPTFICTHGRRTKSFCRCPGLSSLFLPSFQRGQVPANGPVPRRPPCHTLSLSGLLACSTCGVQVGPLHSFALAPRCGSCLLLACLLTGVGSLGNPPFSLSLSVSLPFFLSRG